MSPTVNNFVHDLVAMAKAMEDLPRVEQELSVAHQDIETLRLKVQSLELTALQRKAEIDTLHDTIRSLEVARDDAELRFLEADDRTMRALEFIKSSFGAAGALIQALEPPKSMPEPVSVPVDPTPSVSSGPTEVGSSGATEAGSTHPNFGPANEVMSGQSAADPTASSTTTPSQTASSNDVGSMGVSSTQQPDLDPEPSQRWSHEWYDWRDRQNAKAAE